VEENRRAQIRYTTDLAEVDWDALVRTLEQDDFHNGRTPEQMARSFHNSAFAVLAWDGDACVGTVRVLSDGVCNAYIVDVWTLSSLRRRGIGRRMMELALARLPGQHVYLFTDTMAEFYTSLGFRLQGDGYGIVVGEWLQNAPDGGDARPESG
jgi:ribosomal protein S18 acetylase RimI-like enzyme